MRLTKLYVRFFRSFNFDYERKADRKAEPKDWEMVDEAWFPFVRVDLDPAVTAVVGANESGKSHLIEAVKQALTGEGIERGDFCRHSSLFSVETGRVRLPDFGVEVEVDSDEQVKVLAELPGGAQPSQRLTLIRCGDGRNLLLDSSGAAQPLSNKQLAALQGALPAPFVSRTGFHGDRVTWFVGR